MESSDDTANRSYFYATVEGWGRRSFFTYFSEFNRDWEGAGTVEALLLTAIFVGSLWTNIVIVYAVSSHRPLRTVTNYFIANLAVADLMFAVNIPFVAIVRVTGSWVLGDVVCRSLFYFQCVCGALLIWSLALISVDRYRCIVVPPVRAHLTVRQVSYVLSAMWMACLALFVPIAVWFTVIEFPLDSGSVFICTLVFPHHPTLRLSLLFLITVLFAACIVPTAILLFNYYAIFLKLTTIRHKHWLRSNRNGEVPTQPTKSPKYNETQSKNEQRSHRSHRRTIKILFLDVIFVLTMWLPLMIIVCLIYGSSNDDGHVVQSCHFFYCVLMAFANTCLNPILYGALNDNFRRSFAVKCGRGGERRGEQTLSSTAGSCGIGMSTSEESGAILLETRLQDQ